MLTKIKIKELTNKEREIICHSYNCIDGCPFCHNIGNGDVICIRDEEKYADTEIVVLTNKLNPKKNGVNIMIYHLAGYAEQIYERK